MKYTLRMEWFLFYALDWCTARGFSPQWHTQDLKTSLAKLKNRLKLFRLCETGICLEHLQSLQTVQWVIQGTMQLCNYITSRQMDINPPNFILQPFTRCLHVWQRDTDYVPDYSSTICIQKIRAHTQMFCMHVVTHTQVCVTGGMQ